MLLLLPMQDRFTKMGDIVDVEAYLQAEICEPTVDLGDKNVLWVREGDDET
jgi:hypothetical protein